MLSADALKRIDREIAKYPPQHRQSAVMAALRTFPAAGWNEEGSLDIRETVSEDKFRELIELPNMRPISHIAWTLPRLENADAAIAFLPKLPNLHNVGFQYVPITDVGLKSIGAVRELHRVYLNGAGKFTSAGLVALKGQSRLGILELAGATGIDDDAIPHLVVLPNLGRINLTGTKFTKAGVEKLAAALPKCQIEWDGGTIEPKTP